MTSEQSANPLPYREGQFICSPANISVHRKVDLQDVQEGENDQQRFQDLCTKCTHVFFFQITQKDFGHTALVTLDIRDRGQSAYLPEAL